jgi:hypothetical protein
MKEYSMRFTKAQFEKILAGVLMVDNFQNSNSEVNEREARFIYTLLLFAEINGMTDVVERDEDNDLTITARMENKLSKILKEGIAKLKNDNDSVK